MAKKTTKSSIKNVHAVALGKLGGEIGGPARAEVLSAPRRSAIAKKAAETRWSKSKTQRLASGKQAKRDFSLRRGKYAKGAKRAKKG